MRIVVFGASGNVGGHFVRLAREAGHKLTAVIRPSTRYEPPSGVALEQGDVLDAAFVEGVVSGHEAVMSGLGMRYKHPFAKLESPLDFTSHATRNIMAGMRRAGVKRISLVSAAGVGDSRAGLNWPMRLMLKISNVGLAYADMELVELGLRESGLDFQAVRPTTLNHKPLTGQVRIVERYAASASIPRQDVAAFMLRELERPAFTARTPLITVN